MLVLAIVPNQPLAFVVGVVMGITSITFMTTSTAIVQLRSNPTLRGRVLALQAIVFLGSTPIGGPIVGAISERFGARYALVLGGLAAVGAGIYGVVTVRHASAADAEAAGRLEQSPVGSGPALPQAAR
jgi:MFS family permease